MGGKPSLLLPGTAGTKSALWQGGKQPLGDAEGGFFDEWRIGAAVSLGVACVDQQKHPSVGKRLRLPVALKDCPSEGRLATRRRVERCTRARRDSDKTRAGEAMARG